MTADHPNKGRPKTPGSGRKKGTKNKVDRDCKAAIAFFIEANIPRLNDLLDKVEREEGAKAAFDCIMSVYKHVVPAAKSGQPLDGNMVIYVNAGYPAAPYTQKPQILNGQYITDESGEIITDPTRCN